MDVPQSRVAAFVRRIGLSTGIVVTLAERAGPRDEVGAAVRWLVERHGDGHRWRDCALVVPGKRKWRDPVVAALDAGNVPHRLLIGHPGAVPDHSDDVVHAVSLYTPVACAVVAIVGLGDLPWKQQSEDEAREAIVAAVRRTSSQVMLSWSKRSALVDHLVDEDAVAG